MSMESRPTAATSDLPLRGSLGPVANTNSGNSASIPRDMSGSGAPYESMASRASPERKRQRYSDASSSDSASAYRIHNERSNDYEREDRDHADEASKRHKSIPSSSEGKDIGASTQSEPRPLSDQARDTPYEPRTAQSRTPSFHDRQTNVATNFTDARSDQVPDPRRTSSYSTDRQYMDMDRRERLPQDVTDYALATKRMPSSTVMEDARSPDVSHRVPSMHQRAGSPPPRLPSFASFNSEGAQMRGREEPGAYGEVYPGSPRRAMHSSFRPLQYVSHAAPLSRPPISHHPNSMPTSVYGNPPMIHPSLTGLSGAGGGAGGKQQPSFVSKLYSMLEDPSISDLISWGHTGTVFSVANPTEFSRLVLPNWFKHSNWQSFVRQLNMYGFHKVNHSYQGNPNDEVQVWEFRHPSFRRGEIALLNDIKRKSSRQKRSGSPRGSLSGADLRAERSGGSASPSPEVPMAVLPSSAEGPRAGTGSYPVPREYMYGDERIYPLDMDRRSDARHAYEQERGSFNQYSVAGSIGYARVKPEEGASGVAATSATLPVGPNYTRDDPTLRRRTDSFLDREEATIRFDDLSERTDAIIRHASFLESQVRILSDQLSETRAMSRRIVQDDMLQLLDRLERALSAPAPPGVDAVQRMLEVIRKQLSYYSNQYGSQEHRQTEAQSQSSLKRSSF